MLNRIFLSSLFATGLLLNSSSFAFSIDEEHPIKTTININEPHSKAVIPQTVMLMNIKLTPTQKAKIINYKPIHSNRKNELPTNADVSMNVPVLNQGNHGSCVTFAVTAAMDALLNKGDYISQLCNLELGRYLKLKGNYPSGWNGSMGPIVIDQMLRFGAISKEVQLTNSCAGVTEYPLSDYEEIGNPMSLDEFKKNSINLFDKGMDSQKLLSGYERFADDPNDAYDGEKLLNQVKSYLANASKDHSMITFGTILPNANCGLTGACATRNAQFDTWALTDEVKISTEILGGHEMVITGYDDNATALGTDGKTYKGLFTLRNSWGERAGDHGNYYMTYDFFMKYVLETNRLMLNEEA